MIQQSYRPEIDGLRAIAVLGVLLFHFGFTTCSGGFTGVDVFFVISGFLITQNIVVDCQANSFSFSRFYIRRMRRLFPALFATWLLTLLGGFLLFTPEHYEQLGRSMISSILSVSNFLFWSESGYFDTSAHFKPLLHTWSLSVEEQFYMVWPAILFGLSKLRKTFWIFVFLIISGLISLLFAERMLATDPAAAFFLAPFRIIEFVFGALLVWAIRFQPKNRLILEPLLVLGLGLIVYSFTTFTEKTAFPGYTVLIPCLGAVLVIYSGSCRYTGRLVRNPLAVGIGLISYSLYLVHWPLLVFFHYWRYTDLVLANRIGLLAASGLLAYLSYRYIEQPFRRGQGQKSPRQHRTYAVTCAGLAALLIGISAIIWRLDGFPQRISNKFAQIKNSEQFHIDQFGGKGYPTLGMIGALKSNRKNYDVVLAGDSFAHQYAAGFDRLFKEQKMMAAIATDFACILGPDITFLYKEKADEACSAQNAMVFKLLANNNKPLILSQAWTWYDLGIADLKGKQITFSDQAHYIQFLIGNLRKIRTLVGSERKIIIIGNPPGSGNKNGVLSCLNRPNYLPNNCLESMTFNRDMGNGLAINTSLAAYAKSTANTYFLNPYEVFCNENTCTALDYREDKIWYSDGEHISIDGSLKAVDFFKEEISRILETTPK